MAYCAYTDIQYLAGTGLSQTILEALIAQADREIDAILAKSDLAGSATGAIKSASIHLTMALLYSRYQLDGTMGNSISLDGTLTKSDNIDAAIKTNREIGLKLIQDYIDENATDADEGWVAITNGE